MSNYYTFNFDGCIKVPKGSKVQLIDHQNENFAFIYNNMWFGYYHFSLFKPYFSGTKKHKRSHFYHGYSTHY